MLRAAYCSAAFYIIHLKIRQLLEYLFCVEACCEQIEYIDNSNSHSADARLSSTLFGIDSDAL